MPSFGELVSNTPIISRVIVLASLVLTLLASTETISPSSLLFSWRLLRARPYEFYRIWSSMFFTGPFSLFWPPIFISFFQQMSGVESRLGSWRFFGFLVSATLIMLGITFIWPISLLSSVFLPFLRYYWARLHRDTSITLYIVSFPAGCYPWLMAFYARCVNGSAFYELLGIALGHAYWWSRDVLVRLVGWSPITLIEDAVIGLGKKVTEKRQSMVQTRQETPNAFTNPWASGPGRAVG